AGSGAYLPPPRPFKAPLSPASWPAFALPSGTDGGSGGTSAGRPCVLARSDAIFRTCPNAFPFPWPSVARGTVHTGAASAVTGAPPPGSKSSEREIDATASAAGTKALVTDTCSFIVGAPRRPQRGGDSLRSHRTAKHGVFPGRHRVSVTFRRPAGWS